MEWRFIVSLIIAVFVATFAIQNASSVEISILFAKYNMSQALVILISAILGATAVFFLGIIRFIKINMKLKGALKKIDALEKENEGLTQKLEEIPLHKDDMPEPESQKLLNDEKRE